MFGERTVLQKIVKYGTCKDNDDFILCDLCPYSEDGICSLKREALKSAAEQKSKELDNKLIQPRDPEIEDKPIFKEVWFFYYNEEKVSFNGDWNVVARRSYYYPSFEAAWDAKEEMERDVARNSSCRQILGPILKGYIKEEN